MPYGIKEWLKMKKCPCCGYEDTPSARQLLRLYKKEFGDIPVTEMISRCWINGGELGSVKKVRAALINFFGLKDADELDAFVAGEYNPPFLRNVIVCDIEPSRAERSEAQG